MRPARNYSLLRKIICTDQIYINPTQLVRLTFMHNLIYPHLIQIHILKKEESNLLYLKQQFPWKACLQMGLLQVLKASEKKGTVPSTFKRTTLFVTFFSWPPLCSELETEQKKSAWYLKAILQLSSSGPWKMFGSLWGTAVILLLSWGKGMYPKTLV